jgi:putative membrane protein
MNDEAAESNPRFQVKSTAADHFAWLRTRLAVERTLMAWIRTAAALIGFGFTIVQFFERLGHMEGARAAANPELSRYLGLALIAAGTSALVISLVQYRSVVHYLAGGEFATIASREAGPRKTPLLVVAIFLSVVGTFAFLSVLLRLD